MKTKLPSGIKVSDFRFRPVNFSAKQGKKLEEMGLGRFESLEIFQKEDGEWMVGTLPIGKTRTYAISIKDKKIWTASPKNRQYVYLNGSNFDRVLPLFEIREQGLKQAQSIRDRISSRRAQGQLHRANGLTRWRWS